jgi:hypothetical protein
MPFVAQSLSLRYKIFEALEAPGIKIAVLHAMGSLLDKALR